MANAVVPVLPGVPPVPPAPAFPLDVEILAPSPGSDWSGFKDEFDGHFTELPTEALPAPSRATLNPSQKRAHSPDPPLVEQTDSSPSQLPAFEGGLPGFTAEQVLLFQSCLPAATPSAPLVPYSRDVPMSEELSVPVSSPTPVPPLQEVYADPRPGPSWECDPPLMENQEDAKATPEIVVLLDAEDGDDIHPPP